MKKSTRILSLVFAVVMLVSAIPFSAVAAAGDAAAVESAISAYEGKMREGKIYTNMVAAYDAYTKVCASKDITDANALNEAVGKMSVFTIPTFNAQAYYTTNVATGGYSNVVYTTGNSTTDETSVAEIDKKTAAGVQYKVFAPKCIVLAYDGNEASVPFVLETLIPGKDFCSKQNIIYAESANSVMYFDTVWNGYMDGTGTDGWKRWPKDNISTPATLSATSSDTSTTHTPNNKNTSRFWWNKLVYHGSGNTTDYYETFSNTAVNIYMYYDNWGGKYLTVSPAPTSSIYVINYAPLRNIIESHVAKVQSYDVADYRQGGLRAILKTLDGLTSNTTTNPNNYAYTNTASDVTACASAIKSVVDGYSAPAVPKADSATVDESSNTVNTAMVVSVGGQVREADDTRPGKYASAGLRFGFYVDGEIPDGAEFGFEYSTNADFSNSVTKTFVKGTSGNSIYHTDGEFAGKTTFNLVFTGLKEANYNNRIYVRAFLKVKGYPTTYSSTKAYATNRSYQQVLDAVSV